MPKETRPIQTGRTRPGPEAVKKRAAKELADGEDPCVNGTDGADLSDAQTKVMPDVEIGDRISGLNAEQEYEESGGHRPDQPGSMRRQVSAKKTTHEVHR